MNNREVLNKITDSRGGYLSDNKLSTIFTCKYNKQAIDFLVATSTKMTFLKLGLAVPSWGKSLVNKYLVTLENKKHSFSFEFHDSIVNTENKVTLEYKFYSVLAALGYNVPESFDDFCSEFGYEFKNESDYIKTKQTHIACLHEYKNLRKLFTDEQLNMLSEIS